MKIFQFYLVAVLTIGVSVCATTELKSQPATDAVMPSITIEDTPITSAIENLSRFAGQDYLLDPNLCSSFLDSNGKPTKEPRVSFSWTNRRA